jgi:hypothetical protein
VASATHLPFVSPWIALPVGMVIVLTLGNPYPLTGLQLITDVDPDIALIDLGLPGLDGFTVASGCGPRIENGRG